MLKQERRCFNRIPFRAPLRFQIRGKPSIYSAVCENISLGGLGFISEKFLAPATNLSLQINILSRVTSPFGRVISATPLLHSDRYHVGVEFENLDLETRRRLIDYIQIQTTL
jgi:c-di-GMP-binding flagellar brake protein YcgR